MKKQSLLQKAKTYQLRRRVSTNITNEDIELALAWAKGEISHGQVEMALWGTRQTHASAVYLRLAMALRAYIQKNGAL